MLEGWLYWRGWVMLESSDGGVVVLKGLGCVGRV